jgi:hypothetical protein
MIKRAVLLLIVLVSASIIRSQQIPDKTFEPNVANPAYPQQKGPVVLLDEAHYNFHTAEGRYYVFAKILRKDGYQVKSNKEKFTPTALQEAQILVIANALNIRDSEYSDKETEWTLPTLPAFTDEEVQVVADWVMRGGSLFLCADHMPFPGAAFHLGKAFGYTLYNGFASETVSGLLPGKKKELDVFTKEKNTLATHPITVGRNVKEQVDKVATFTGQAFQIPQNAVSLLTFDENYEVLLPDTAWIFGSNTDRIPAKGLSQGAISEYGKGRIAVFGEAAMFSGQLKGIEKKPMGLNSPDAKQNLQFLLNLIHWLDGIVEAGTIW